MISFSTLIVFISFYSGIANSAYVCNNASFERMDIAMSKALNVGKYHRNFPVNFAQVGEFCDEETEQITIVEEYKNRCMKNLPKQLTAIILYSIKQMIKSLCKKNSKRLQRLLNSAQCANKAQDQYSRCQSLYIDALQGAFYEEEKRKIPLTCCEFYKLYACMRSTAKKHEVCDEDKIEANVEYVSDIFNNMINTLCGDWTEDSDKCAKLRPPMKKKRSDKRTASFLMPFIKVLDSFPEV